METQSNRRTVNNCCEWEIESNECSMCGDVGFKELLFKCSSCFFRYQHTYCSSLYPNIDLERALCEWCRVTAQMAETEADHNSGFNNVGFSKLQSISASKDVCVITRMERREDGEEIKSDLFNVKQRRQQKEKPKLQIHGGRRYKRLADL